MNSYTSYTHLAVLLTGYFLEIDWSKFPVNLAFGLKKTAFSLENCWPPAVISGSACWGIKQGMQ